MSQPPSIVLKLDPLLYSRQDAAHMLGISLRQLTYMLARKQIGFRKNGRKVLISIAEIKRVSRSDIVT